MEAATLTKDEQRLAALCEIWREEKREIWVTMLTGSMRPAIPAGSLVCLSCHKEEPQIGEIIAYRQNDVLTIHRLQTIRQGPSGERFFICRGDANLHSDDPISPGRIVGRVIEVRRPSLFQRGLAAVKWRTVRAFDGLMPSIRRK